MASESIKSFSYKYVLLDIEGTTTSISFVKDVLFKYVRENVQEYLSKNFEENETKQVIEQLRLQVISDEGVVHDGYVAVPNDGSDPEKLISSTVKNILRMMDQDLKVGPLKTLQGYMWQSAYEDGLIKGHVYSDVMPALKEWTNNGVDVYIYSSGSVKAQKLLFHYSEEGDLLKYIKGHFDTSIGAKVESQSYINIVESINATPDSILFLTDVPKEAYAATEAGLKVVLSERPGNKPLEEADRSKFQVINSFDELIKSEMKEKREMDENDVVLTKKIKSQ